MRLLSFLSDIERALAEGGADGGWHGSRMVNFQQGLARLTLTAQQPGRSPAAGAIFLQAFALADGSVCLKASLTWKGSEAFPSLAIYSTPTVNWESEARRVTAAWLAGPSAHAAMTVPAAEPLVPLAAAAG